LPKERIHIFDTISKCNSDYFPQQQVFVVDRVFSMRYKLCFLNLSYMKFMLKG